MGGYLYCKRYSVKTKTTSIADLPKDWMLAGQKLFTIAKIDFFWCNNSQKDQGNKIKHCLSKTLWSHIYLHGSTSRSLIHWLVYYDSSLIPVIVRTFPSNMVGQWRIFCWCCFIIEGCIQNNWLFKGEPLLLLTKYRLLMDT